MKTVFSNQMCGHVWAQLSQPHGRSNSMRFDGALGYSYQTPIAHIVTAPNGERIALFDSRTYSMTTSSKHMPAYRRGASHFVQFSVPDIFAQSHAGTIFKPAAEFDHAINLKHFAAKYETARAALMRCPADSWRLANTEPHSWRDEDSPQLLIGIPLEKRTRAHTELAGIYAEVLRYCTAFSIVVPAVAWVADADAAIARRDRIMNDPKRARKMALAAAARNRAEIAKAEKREEKRRIDMLESAERVRLWQSGNTAATLRYDDTPHDASLLRIHDGRVQTSRGAECPLEHAIRALRVWRLAINANALPWTRGDFAEQDAQTVLGHFKLDAINTDGSIRAGCHTIQRAELERFETEIAGMVQS